MARSSGARADRSSGPVGVNRTAATTVGVERRGCRGGGGPTELGHVEVGELLEHPANPSQRRYGRRLGRVRHHADVELLVLSQLDEHGGHVVQPARVGGPCRQVQCGRFPGGDPDVPGGGGPLLGGDLAEP